MAETKVIHRIAVADVKIRVKRQRSEMGDLEGLAESLLRYGQLTPIILTRDNELIAGERRLEGHKMNCVTHIDAVYRDELDAADLEELELEENLQRKQLTWKEEELAKARIHKLRVAKDPNWSQMQTAAVVAKPGQMPQQRDVSQALNLEKMIKLFPEIGEAKTKAQALNLAKAKAKSITRAVDVSQRPEVYAEVTEKIWLGDSVQLIKEIENEAFDLVLTDPPFGINYDAHVAGTVGEENSYIDTVEKYEYILSMLPDVYRVLKPDSFLVWFFGMTWYQPVKDKMRAAGFIVDEIPIMWDRSDGRCFTNVPNHYFTKGYDVAFHAFKGDPHIVKKNLSNVLRFPPVETKDRDLVVERPVEMYQEIIERLTIPGQSVVDFFVGSGSVTAAAARSKRDYLGIELDPNRRANAIQKTRANIAS